MADTPSGYVSDHAHHWTRCEGAFYCASCGSIRVQLIRVSAGKNVTTTASADLDMKLIPAKELAALHAALDAAAEAEAGRLRANAELGALVRLIPAGWDLAHDAEGWWAIQVDEGEVIGPWDTPAEALTLGMEIDARAALAAQQQAPGGEAGGG